MWPRFGIKIGNSTLCIAHVKADGKVEVIANKQGDRVSQACLLWSGGNEIECGLTAKQKMSTRPKQAIANSFQLLQPLQQITKVDIRDIPCDFDSAKQAFQLKCAVPGDNDGEPKMKMRELSAYEVHIHLFRAELDLARQYHGDASEKPIVVLSIPSYYTNVAKEQLAKAAETAGFHVAQVIKEPTAAVLAYGIGEGDLPRTVKHVLAIKSGGLFSHFALYAVTNGFYTQLDEYGPFPIGGRQYTDALVQFICEEFTRKYKLDAHESRRSLAKIRTAASNCKHILTTLPSTQVYIDSLMDGVDFNMQMSRARFESLIQPVIAGFMQTLNECVERALQQHADVKHIGSIVLLGGTMQIPKLQSAIAARFPDAQVHASLSADEVVAIGCARQALYLVDPNDQVLETTDDFVCADEDMHIWHGDDEANAQILLEKGAQLPSTVQLVFNVGETTGSGDGKVFKLRTGASVNQLHLKDSNPVEDGVLRVIAEVCYKEDTQTPVVHLRSA